MNLPQLTHAGTNDDCGLNQIPLNIAVTVPKLPMISATLVSSLRYVLFWPIENRCALIFTTQVGR
jgi:hypothetical protein